MDFNKIEQLVKNSKNGCMSSKEILAEQFKPFILNISKRTFLHGYTMFDIQNECYYTLLHCIDMYNLHSQTFVAYATNAIKHNIYDLIEKNKKRSFSEGAAALTLSDNLENVLPCQTFEFEDHIHQKNCINALCSIFKELSCDEKEMIDFLYIKKRTLTSYSYWKNLSYSSARYKQRKLLKKLQQKMNKKHIYSIDK